MLQIFYNVWPFSKFAPKNEGWVRVGSFGNWVRTPPHHRNFLVGNPTLGRAGKETELKKAATKSFAPLAGDETVQPPKRLSSYVGGALNWWSAT